MDALRYKAGVLLRPIMSTVGLIHTNPYLNAKLHLHLVNMHSVLSTLTHS